MDEIMTIKELSQYLKMNERTISKLATKGLIPATKIANQWRFMRGMINQWLEQQMVGPSSRHVGVLESELVATPVYVTQFLTPECIIPDAIAGTKVELLEEILDFGVKKKLLKSSAIMLRTLITREALCSTALGDEVAIPHPRQPLGESYVKPMIIMARSLRGVDFNALDNLPIKLVFLLCLPNEYTHLKVLAKLMRMLKDVDFREALKSAPGASDIYHLIRSKDIQLSQRNGN